ncbi:MAG: hypothetical protein M1829_000911 [Trizodia sp. TS-e1964]|nr:MAG: hypothetical protein M1829_000911 [Trizodia sp. TS-e1964]
MDYGHHLNIEPRRAHESLQLNMIRLDEEDDEDEDEEQEEGEEDEEDGGEDEGEDEGEEGGAEDEGDEDQEMEMGTEFCDIEGLLAYPPHTHSIHHHHHRLPDQGNLSGMEHGGASDSSILSTSTPSMVGKSGMPSPALRPRGPKLKFTPKEDLMLVDLKENKSLTWKQISEFFPGRSSGTLQVRYCTKLKVKSAQWTDDTISRLRKAISEYENDRWRLISAKVGSGFSPAACKEKAKEL